MQQLGIDIPAPPSSPKTWGQLRADCMQYVLPVRQMLEARGGLDVQILDQIQVACVAALLANLLRDVRVDMIEHDRLYLPAEVASEHGLDLSMMSKALSLDADRGCDGDLRDGSCDCALMPRGDMLALRKPYRATLSDLVGRTHELSDEVQSVWRGLPDGLSPRLHGLVLETHATLKMIARHDYDTLTRRPTLGALPRAWNRFRLRLSR